MDIKEMEEKGVADYYCKLTSFITFFIEKNHPLSKKDLKALMNESTTENVNRRNIAFKAMKEEMNTILQECAKENEELIDKGINLNRNSFNEKLDEYIQRLMEKRFNALNQKTNFIVNKK